MKNAGCGIKKALLHHFVWVLFLCFKRKKHTKTNKISRSGCDRVGTQKESSNTSFIGALSARVISCSDFAMFYAGRRWPGKGVVEGVRNKLKILFLPFSPEKVQRNNLFENTPKPHVAQKTCGIYKVCIHVGSASVSWWKPWCLHQVHYFFLCVLRSNNC